MKDIRSRVLHGFPVQEVNPTGSRIERARLAVANVANGDVRMARGPWNGALLDELGSFPGNSGSPDQVDVLAYAFHQLAGRIGGRVGATAPRGSGYRSRNRLPQSRRSIVRNPSLPPTGRPNG